MIEENPELVQPETWTNMNSWSGKTPVFLFHDGGGTTYAYHCLDPIQRFVYGVRNPYFFNEKRFEGGLPEMAAQYVAWIKEAVAAPDFPAKPRGAGRGKKPVDILVGGWSLGGMTSLEVARQLQGDTAIRVKGILMIDSVYPGPTTQGTPASGGTHQEDAAATAAAAAGEAAEEQDHPAALAAEEEGKTRNQVLSIRAMREARRMVASWTVPRWEHSNSTGDDDLVGRWPPPPRRPPAVLIRAKDSIFARDWSSALDANRADRTLGWRDYDADMFLDVLDVEGHHFSMFDHSKIPGITAAIEKALAKLDSPSANKSDAWETLDAHS